MEQRATQEAMLGSLGEITRTNDGSMEAASDDVDANLDEDLDRRWPVATESGAVSNAVGDTTEVALCEYVADVGVRLTGDCFDEATP